MQTECLYYEDAYIREFDGVVISCEKQGKVFHVILDRTAFYPEGGGQPCDLGLLGGQKVLDVQIIDGDLIHVLSGPLKEGGRVHGILDWDRRFDLMQQHSGEHLVSGMIHDRYGYDNVGFHMGEEMITIDLSGPVDKKGLEEIEDQVNRYIWEDHESLVVYPDEKERKDLPYRSKKELTGEVRLVHFPGGDLCACCGMHVRRSSEIGLVKLVSVRRFHEGVRIEMVSGRRAFEWLKMHQEQNARISVMLSARPDESAAAVRKLLDDNYRMRGDLMQANARYYLQLAAECAGKGNVMVAAPAMEPSDIQKCIDSILDSCQGRAVLVSGSDEEGYRFAAGERDGDVRDLAAAIREKLGGRGGGKPFFIQGMMKATMKEIETFFREQGYSLIQ